MAQIFQTQAAPSALQSLGSGLGQGIGSTLQLLAQNKLNQIAAQSQQAQQSQQIKDLARTFQQAEFSPQESEFLAGLYTQAPQLAQELFKRGIPLGQQQSPVAQQQQPSFQQSLQTMFQPQEVQNMQQEQAEKPGLEQLLGSLKSQDPLSIIKALNATPAQEQAIRQELVEQPRLTQPAVIPPQVLTPAQQEQVAAAQAKRPTFRELLAKPYESPELQFRKEEAARKEAQKERIAGFKETKEERKAINEQAKAARDNLRDLERLEDLQKEGKLDTPGYVELLSRSGLDIPALLSPGSEEFNKIAANFVRDAKAVFGARISNYEVEQFLKTIPSLSQSPEGRKRVIANLKQISRTKLAYSQAMKDVIKENKGVPPLDLAEQIDDRIENKLDSISKKFKDDILKPVPPSQNKLVTALQATIGSIIGAPGALLGKAGKALSLLG